MGRDELVEIETGNATKTYESAMKAILEIVAKRGSPVTEALKAAGQRPKRGTMSTSASAAREADLG